MDSSTHGPEGIQQDLEKELYRQIVEVTNEGIWVINTVGRTTYANERMAEMLGFTVQELMGKNAFDLVFPEDLTRGYQEFDLRRIEKEGRQIQFRYRKKDGSKLWTIGNSSVITGPQERIHLARESSNGSRTRAVQHSRVVSRCRREDGDRFNTPLPYQDYPQCAVRAR